jgi:aminoglycoside/choline kinase family phosphotransferase
MNISKKLSQKYKKYNILKVDGGASRKKIYRLEDKNKSFILTDFNSDKDEYKNHMNVYNVLKDTNISIPKIIEKYNDSMMIISEDFGSLRFDKILNNYSIKNLLNYAVDTLVVLKNSIHLNKEIQISQYNFDIFKKEILELPQYYFPHIKIDNKNLTEEFTHIWSEAFLSLDLKFNSFIHKDFNINNLILLPSRKKHLKCGVIDFQNAFWGHDTWDLFSLLEDSRVLFTDEFNDYFINHYYLNTDQNITIEDFKMQFYFLNSSRQTRLLGRWIKLSNELNKDFYLNFIPITKQRLKKSITKFCNNDLINFYNKYIFS